MSKDLTVENIQDAQKKVSDIKVYGDGDTFALLCKASSESQGWMKSTKVCNVDNGCIVQVSTQQRNPDGSYAVAEALTYVPNVNLDKTSEPRVLNVAGLYGCSPLTAYAATPEEEQRREKQEQLYQHKEYLMILLELQKASHDCHEEINKTLEKINELMY